MSKHKLILAHDCTACEKLLNFIENNIEFLPDLSNLEIEKDHSVLDDREKLGIESFPTLKKENEIVAVGYTDIASYLMIEFF